MQKAASRPHVLLRWASFPTKRLDIAPLLCNALASRGRSMPFENICYTDSTLYALRRIATAPSTSEQGVSCAFPCGACKLQSPVASTIKNMEPDNAEV